MRLAHALPAVLSLGALALLASYSMPLPEKARVAWSLSPPPAQAQSNPTEQNAPAQGHAITVLTAPGANPYRDFCVVDASKAGKGPSLFNDLTSPSLREAVAAAVRDPTPDTKLRKKQALKRFETSSPCSWTKYLVCNDNMWGETPDYLKMCTHDPKVDTMISGTIHEGNIWFPHGFYKEIVSRLDENGRCPPDRPVVLDLGLNIGSFAMYLLERGCHVIGFDALVMNVERVIQSAAANVGEDGRSFLEHFHGFQNALGNVVGSFNITVHPTNVGASRVSPEVDETIEPKWVKTVNAVVLEELFYTMPAQQRPQIRVGKQGKDGEWEYDMVPLQPEHVYMVKVDVEGFDVPTLYSLRRLFEADIVTRPVSVMAEFNPVESAGHACNSADFVSFLYTAGYVYKTLDNKPMAYREAQALIASLHAATEGWWDLAEEL